MAFVGYSLHVKFWQFNYANERFNWGVKKYIFIIIGAYALSCIASIIYQYSACKAVNAANIFISNLIVLRNVFIASFILFLDTYPIFDKPVALTPEGLPVSGGPVNEKKGLEFFVDIVKAVLPQAMDDSVKNGIAHSYWMFWASLLPIYFLVGIQGLCEKA